MDIVRAWHRGPPGSLLEGALDGASERLIAISRVILATGGLIAVYLDPSQPSQGTIGYAFLGVYVVFSLAILATISRPLGNVWAIASHGVEIGLICLIIEYTEGPSSPFFVYFTFVLLTATLRWQWRGAIVTGALLSFVLIVLTITQFVTDLAGADVDRLIIRNIYLLVASILFAVLGDQLGRSQSRLSWLRLAQELHDGILQTMTAVRLKLYAAAAATAGRHRASLIEAGQLLDEEQRHIRAFVEDSRNLSSHSERPNAAFQLAELRTFAEHLQRLWECSIDMKIEDTDISIAPEIGAAIKLMIGEAIANAVVHGKATSVAVDIGRDATGIVLKIIDNGNGLRNAQGSYDHAQLVDRSLGPRSLVERVSLLGGSLRLSTSAQGVKLQFILPGPLSPRP